MAYRKHNYTPGERLRPGTPILRADACEDTEPLVMPLRWNRVSERYEGGPDYPAVGSIIPPEQNFGQYGYVVGKCGHRVAGSEYMAGLHNCERCGG